MMHIHIDQLKDKALWLEFEERPEIFPVLTNMIKKNECEFVSPIKTRLRAIRVGDIVEVEGSIETSVRLACGRCLNDFKTQLASRFALTYLRESPADTEKFDEKEIELKADDMGLIYFREEEINLLDGIQEQVVMALPLQPLCQESCKGLCPICGANLNEGSCDCARTPFNPKLAALQNIKLENNKDPVSEG